MNGNKITLGVIAALIAAKVRQGSRYKDTYGNKYDRISDQDILNMQVAEWSNIPFEQWEQEIVEPFADPRVMDMLTRNMFINSNSDFYQTEMVFIAENLGQLYRADMCPIQAYAKQISQDGVQVITNNQMNMKAWLRSHPDQVEAEYYEETPDSFLFMIKLRDPMMLLDLETSCLIADTIGPQLYHDVYYNLTM